MALSHDLPVLVAPRPVRLAAAFAFPRPARPPPPSPLRDPADNDQASPSPSPLGRSQGLPSEALEEFLAILRPSIFQSSSPTLHKSRRSLTIPAFHQYDRPLALRTRQRIETSAVARSESDEHSDTSRRSSTTPEPQGTDQQDTFLDPYDQDGPGIRWWPSTVLSSPISRMQTRNPFLKQVAEYSTVPAPPLSPAAIPLPAPSPGELLDN